MKKLVKVVGRHARKHRNLLDQAWRKTNWTRPQAQQVLGRIDHDGSPLRLGKPNDIDNPGHGPSK
jgi:hypothetical protein